MVFSYLIVITIDFQAYISLFLLLVLNSIRKIYQILEIVFYPISKHLEVHQKYSATRRILNSLPGV